MLLRMAARWMAFALITARSGFAYHQKEQLFLIAPLQEQIPTEPHHGFGDLPQNRTVIDVLNASPDHLIFVRLLQRARLIPYINKLQEFDDENVGLTVLAPTDRVWPREFRAALGGDTSFTDEQVDAAIVNSLQMGSRDNIQEFLQDLLLYHFVNRSVVGDISESQWPARLLTTLQRPHDHITIGNRPDLMLEGQKILMRQNTSAVFFGWSYGNDTVWEMGSAIYVRMCSKGIVVALDRVLRPPPTLDVIVRTHPALEYMNQILSEDELVRVGKSPSTTAFLPTDGAFNALSPLERRYLEGPWAISRRDDVRVLAWHLTSSEHVLYGHRLQDREVVMALGGSHKISLEDGQIKIGSANVVETDILTANGVVHLVDSLLSPYHSPTLALTVEKVLLASNASHFVDLIHRAGLASYITRSPSPGDEDNDEATRRSPMTFLAPGDRAITQISSERGREELRGFLKYHFLGKAYSTHDLTDGMLLPTELQTSALQGASQRMPIHVHGSTLAQYPDISFGEASIVGEPIAVGKDRVFFISQFIEPPEEPMQVAVSTLTMSAFVAWIYSGAMEDQVSHTPALTGLFPSNKAFAQLGLLANFLLHVDNREALQSVLQYHLLRGVHYSDTIRGMHQPYDTLQGSTIDLSRSKTGNLSITSRSYLASVIQKDLLTSNGVIHQVDRLLLPLEMEVTIGDLLRASKLETMEELILLSNYSWILKAEGSYIVLAPSADGFGRTNLTKLRSDPFELDKFIGLHILQAERRPDHLDQHQPIALQDGATLSTLYPGKFSRLALRRLSHREDDSDSPRFQIGILGARGTSGDGHASAIISHGMQIRPANDTRPEGGVLVLASALDPYEPNWFFKWCWPAALAVFSLLSLSLLLFISGRYLIRKRRDASSAPLEGEEE
ncbi:Fasciclin-domain-containing protein [Tilletiaria anomala UBC 951]|uniref:Fasciclin-domain-containing protein n=1 Tax=Tilletiaria anomala (strain ATCC 24038 / CBS 436.72 / UBC 951) TaxID=1037660 RepID=A0A066VLX7_TILAU|nr:Fasciclin-domain-containing protein [Tilletiaria anomala UBC 951]KDN42747.1 Fasciclin-domain-containing protein [Tilletiaria anomala UBC 951]